MPSNTAPFDSESSSWAVRSVREPALLRLAQSIEELNPDLARSLCHSGLAAINDPAEREAWRERLRPWLDADNDDGGSPVIVAA